MHDFDAGVHVAHMAELMRLPVHPEWRDTIVAHMAATARAAALFVDFEIDDHIEPAPVFEP